MAFVNVESKEPIKVVKPKPKRPSEEQKKTEKAKAELKRRIPPEFQDFAESKITIQPPRTLHILKHEFLSHKPSPKVMMITLYQKMQHNIYE